MGFYDPLELGKLVEDKVSRTAEGRVLRKYYRFRGGGWYGGIATADAVGCNMKCLFCWSWRERDRYEFIGSFHSPEEVALRLLEIASKRGYRLLRISGGEPTLAFEHLNQVLSFLNVKAGSKYTFILETNGLMLGKHKELSYELSKYPFLHVRVSLKGCTEEEFERITGARREFFSLQLKALENLLEAGVSSHAAVMISFSKEENCTRLREKLFEIDPSLAENFEEEVVIMYPHVKEILRIHGIWPKIYEEPRKQ